MRLLLVTALLLVACSEQPSGGRSRHGGGDPIGLDSGAHRDAVVKDAAEASEADAGTPDPDAGEIDPDAGEIDPDAGAPDAMQVDSGAPDTGRPDAGSADAGPLDSGLPDSGPPDSGPVDTGVPPTADFHVDIFVDNFCNMMVVPASYVVPSGQTVYFDWHNHSTDYAVDVWMSYGGGYLDLATGATWDEPIGHCIGPNPHTEYADISTACSSHRFLIECQ